MEDVKYKRRERRYRMVYDISVEEYDRMFAYQGGGCAICHRPPKALRLSVDHDHKTGEVRGLLCMGCNQELKERITPQWLKAALDYMQQPPVLNAIGRIPHGRIGRVNKRRRK